MVKRNEKGSLFLLAALAAVIVVILAAQAKLVVAVGYTDGDDIQKVVYDEVKKAKDRAPGLVRLVFHDAFVRGCDGSVLLTKTPFNAPGKTEQNSKSNGGLRGLEVIDAIRDRLNATGTKISCADAIVFAAREATNILSNGYIKYDVGGPGRKDGVVSSDQDPGKFLPGPTYSYGELVTNFSAKGFNTTEELVALSGAHSIGVAHPLAFSFVDRFLPNATTQIDLRYRTFMVLETKNFSNPEVVLNVRDMKNSTQTLSGYVPNKVNMSAVGVLDNSYYNANLQNMVLFTSDWTLRTNAAAEQLMEDYKTDANLWYTAFKAAMTKLSNKLEAEGPLFEIGYRNKCSDTNYDNVEAYTKKT